MKTRILLLAAALAALTAPLAAQQPGQAAAPAARKQAVATRVDTRPPDIDGRLDDEAWRGAQWVSDFVLREPTEGATPPERTEVAFLIDGGALYVGARMHSLDPSAVRALVGRRDREGGSEQLMVSLDTYRDRRTAYTFAVNAAGVRLDYYHAADAETRRDYSFDPVWEAETARDSAGWTAELRIPLTQLRFSGGADQVWGVNLVRLTPARNEQAFWMLVGRNETGWSSRMGELTGLGDIRPPRRVELMPYVAADGTLAQVDDPRDPFQDEREAGVRVGGDVKVGLGSSFTLDATFNPDFGQVEADPAEVNLSAFETIFAERRPFFTEGTGLLAGRGHFYTRRIGAPPPGRPGTHYFDRLDATTILGAAKITGRTPRGLSLGVLTALTARERAATFDTLTDVFGRFEVAPLTGYGVVSAQQELGRDRSTLGFTLTAVERDLDDDHPLRTLLARRAYSGIVDGRLRWAGGKYDMSAYLGFSHVSGDSAAILGVQTSSRRYFQRPDADHVELDPSRTSLGGLMLGINHSKLAGQHWLWDVDYYEERPGLELNDIGQIGSTDDRGISSNLRYRETTPGKVFRYHESGAYQTMEFNFDGDRTYRAFGLFGNQTWKNFWQSAVNLDWQTRGVSDNLTRGGPLMGTSPLYTLDLSVANPVAARTRLRASTRLQRDEVDGWLGRVDGAVILRPRTRWELSVEPRWLRGVTSRQFVLSRAGGSTATFGRRFVFAYVDRSEVAARIRLNYAISPDLTLETYAEPFASSGRFYDFGELAAAGSQNLRFFGDDGTTLVENPNGTRTVTDGADTFTLPNLDFDVRSFRSNLVLRWEWRPGSTAFLVWQQNRGFAADDPRHVGPGDLWDSLGDRGDNFLALKVSYWLPLR
ncbi:MAG TPA: DUF5916 domain-containing protein [Longimicrobiaceae bacterium]|nr:DUF5916 domain-containing protein [Longimicrobiaceae bacterium]